MNIARLVGSICFLVLLAPGCKKEPPPAPPPPPAMPPPEPPAPPPEPMFEGEALVKAWEDCHFPAMAAHDLEKAASCWTENAKLVVPGMPPAEGHDGIKALLGGFFAAFPDLKVSPQLTLLKGTDVAQVRHLTGTHTAPFMGAPATNKKFGLVALAVDHLAPTGKITGAEHYLDAPTLMAQLGLAKQPARPVAETAGERQLVMATGAATEQANVDLLKAGHEAFNARDWKKMMGLFADDAVISDQGMPTDTKGKKAIQAMMKMFVGAFSDVKITDTALWGAGDYVVSQMTLAGTNDGDMKMMKLKKTGKPINLNTSEIALFKDGKVKQLWWFGNGAEMAMQLGLMPPPGAPPAEKAAAEKP